MRLMRCAVFAHSLIIKPNTYLAFKSQSAASLVSLHVINLFIVYLLRERTEE